jgi:hypothetical protein
MLYMLCDVESMWNIPLSCVGQQQKQFQTCVVLVYTIVSYQGLTRKKGQFTLSRDLMVVSFRLLRIQTEQTYCEDGYVVQSENVGVLHCCIPGLEVR